MVLPDDPIAAHLISVYDVHRHIQSHLEQTSARSRMHNDIEIFRLDLIKQALLINAVFCCRILRKGSAAIDGTLQGNNYLLSFVALGGVLVFWNTAVGLLLPPRRL